MTAAALAEGLRYLGLAVEPSMYDRLIAYRDLLTKWNRSFNLTSVRDPEEMIAVHLLDCLAVLPHLRVPEDAHIIDIGSGGGLPGIPLAIAQPKQRWVLLDSNQKKGTFLRQAALELDLTNVEVAVCRVEAYVPATLFDAAISRAFSSLTTFVSAAMRLLTPIGHALAMKGVEPQEEAAEIAAKGYSVDIIPLVVPTLGAQRCLVVVDRPA